MSTKDLEAQSGGHGEGRARQAFRIAGLMTLLWVLIGLLGVVQQLVSRDAEWEVAASFALLDWGPWVLMSPLVLWFSSKVRVDGRNWRFTVPAHLVAAVVVAWLHHGISEVAIGRGWVTPPRMHHAKESTAGQEEEKHRDGKGGDVNIRFVRMRLTLPIYFVLVAATHAVAYHCRSIERERHILEAEARLTEARLMALQTQLQPHFLFNTLNAVSSLIYSNPSAADEMLCLLSTLLRRVLEVSERREIPLSEELGFVETYLAIQRIRFSDRLRVRVEVEKGLEGVSVPTLILQPLVENAVIHGVAPQAQGGEVLIRGRREGGDCVIEVSNSGRDMKDKMLAADGSLVVKERVGLENVRRRLAALYGTRQSMGLYPNIECGGVCARLRFPLERKEA